MNSKRITTLAAFGLLAGTWLLIVTAGSAGAVVRYVDANSANPAPPYTNWATAASVIQDAVDAAVAGDEIVVTNGLYATGGRAVGTNALVNRVAVDKPLMLRSVNGPELTIIQGYQVPGTTNGDGAIRCVYLTNGASLSGFTLTAGATLTDRDVWREQSGGGLCCESTDAVVSNCAIVSNSAFQYGGGVCGSTLNNCTLAGNWAGQGFGSGGGAFGGILNFCVLNDNSARHSGGGASWSLLNNCVLTGNSAAYGGAASGWFGFSSTLNNCTLIGNSAYYYGGGAEGATLNNCTLTGNSALNGGGAYDCTLNNCIVYFNSATNGANYSDDLSFPTLMSYSCTMPMPTNGIGNITNAPLFVDAARGNYRLRLDSPCIDAGTNLSAILTNDLDGRPRPVDGNGNGVAAFDIGAYEYRALLVSPESPNPTAPYVTWATAAHVIQDAVDAAAPGDEIVVTNGVYATGGRAVGTNLLVNRVAVDKPLTLRSVNGPEVTIIQGYQVPGTTNGGSAIRCAYLASGTVLSGFTLTNGATRSALDWWETYGGGALCASTSAILTNCVIAGNSAYDSGGGASGGSLYNCSVIGNSAGAGGGTSDSILSNCTLARNSASPSSGGGALSCILSNCVITGNSAAWSSGGAHGGMLYNCLVSSNSARAWGGGTLSAWLYNCTVTGNSAETAGGVTGCDLCLEPTELNNCIIYSNTATVEGPNYASYGVLINNSCTTPLPANGVGNITNAPLFVDYAGGNLRLQSNSPCINAGNNSYLTDSGFTNSFDLDGNPRIISGTVDIGAYEFQGPGSTISYAWLQQFGLPTDGSADATDPDADGHTTWQEWRCQTCPTNALSGLRLLSATPDGTNVTVRWQSTAGVRYLLERSTDLSASPPFLPLASGLEGQPGTTSFTDTNAAFLAPLFYRVGVP